MKIKFLQAFNGDSILISFKGKDHVNRNILIDGGTANTYKYLDKNVNVIKSGDLKLTVKSLREAGEKIDLLILTHVDDDHIGGILKWFSEDKTAKDLIGKVWFNSGRLIAEHFKAEEVKENLLELSEIDGINTGIIQGRIFEEYLEKHKIWDRRIIKSGQEISLFDVKFTILSPDDAQLKRLLGKWEKKSPVLLDTGTLRENDYHRALNQLITDDVFNEDRAIHNGSSIAFILEYNSKRFLLLSDAYPSLVVSELHKRGYSKENPLKVDLVKVSHHGSKANTTYELLDIIDCDKFVISSDGSVHNLPDKQCLARIINSKKNARLYFNYPDKIKKIFDERELTDYDFQALPVETEF